MDIKKEQEELEQKYHEISAELSVHLAIMGITPMEIMTDMGLVSGQCLIETEQLLRHVLFGIQELRDLCEEKYQNISKDNQLYRDCLKQFLLLKKGEACEILRIQKDKLKERLRAASAGQRTLHQKCLYNLRELKLAKDLLDSLDGVLITTQEGFSANSFCAPDCQERINLYLSEQTGFSALAQKRLETLEGLLNEINQQYLTSAVACYRKFLARSGVAWEEVIHENEEERTAYQQDREQLESDMKSERDQAQKACDLIEALIEVVVQYRKLKYRMH